MAENVFVGLSGGVDSALTASLLQEEGKNVTCIYMRNWSRDFAGFRCPWAEELASAERVAVTLGLPLEVWDFEDQYEQMVADYVIDSYKAGETPNPDVVCNRTIKFGAFAEQAFSRGADFIATGHWAAVEHGENGATAKLLRARDEHKDQTYFLWQVSGDVFNRVLFPLAELPSKAEAREMCRERGLDVAERPDSTGICFVGPVGMRNFLLDSIEQMSGEIIEWESGNVLGEHDGAFLYTIGQRKGLRLGGGPARFVVDLDTANNLVYVSADPNCPALWTDELQLRDCHWIAGAPPLAGEYLVRLRHTGELMAVTLELGTDAAVGELACAGDCGGTYSGGSCVLHFAEPIKRVAPGQSAVLYDGRLCLGGGIVCRSGVALEHHE